MEIMKLSHSEEWLSLTEGSSLELCSVASKEENVSKNRYSNILPFDKYRVSLPPRENSANDYINASFIDIKNEEKIIVCQAPIQSTIEDFWWMVWTNNIGLIGMFTNFFEGNKIKAMAYWPLNQDQRMLFINEKMSITNKKITVLLESIFTEFEMKYNDQIRTVYHFHYRGWPDFGTPKSIGDIHHFLDIALELRSSDRKEKGLVIHCSAGCGRAGVMCVIYRHLITRESIPDIVRNIREKRMSMVQTDQQYKFIYKIIEKFA